MAINRELSQFASFVEVDNSSGNIGIATTATPYVGIGTTNPVAKFEVVGQTELDDVNIAGIASVGSLNIGSTEVIDSSRELKNIVSLDATTTATIETAIANAPNTFTDLTVTGISTFESNIGVSGVTTTTDLFVTGIASVGAAITMYGATGIISAYKFYGDGSGLTGTISGIGIRSEGADIGYGATIIDFKGPGVSTITSISAGIVTVFFEGGGGESTIDKQTFNVGVAGTNLVTLTNAYTSGNIDVFLNGLKLVPTSDYTETGPTIITLTTPAVNGDVIETISFRTVSIADNVIGIQSAGVSVGTTITTLNFIGAGNTFLDRGNGIIDVSINPPDDTFISNLNVSGIVTTTKLHVGSGTTFTEDLVVTGDARITGILTIGTGTITLDGSTNTINVGSGVTITGSGEIQATSITIGAGVSITSSGITGTASTISFATTAFNLVGSANTASFATTSFGLEGSPPILVSNAGVNTDSSPTNLYVSGNSASNIISIGSTDGNTTLDFSQGNNFSLLLTGSIVLENPTGITTGQSGIILVQQDESGSRTVGFGSHWDFPSATAPTLSTGANALDCLTYFVRNSTSIITNSLIGIGTI